MACEPTPPGPQDFTWMVAMSLAFFALVALALWRETRSEWQPIQDRFRATLEQHGRIDDARRFRSGLRQLWIPQLPAVDRCVTCHLGYDLASVLPADLPQPLGPHPQLPYMDKHPFLNFGCTSCHAGQGWATTTYAAHSGGEHWDEPMLSTPLARHYGLGEGELLQMRCNFCHRHDPATIGMEEIDAAKALFQKRKCIVCHVVEGRGGLTGPELTYIGDKDPELFDFSHVSGPKTVFNWHVQHLMGPDKVTRGTVMPTFGFTDHEARTLTLLLMSWKRQVFPPQYIPNPQPTAATSGLVMQVSAPPEVAGAEEGRKIFETRGCNRCHTIGGGKLLGPDLKGVSSRRAEPWLRTWLADPASMIRAYPELANWPNEYDGIVMPNQNLSAAEISALITYLAKL
jgi:cytochrome c2